MAVYYPLERISLVLARTSVRPAHDCLQLWSLLRARAHTGICGALITHEDRQSLCPRSGAVSCGEPLLDPVSAELAAAEPRSRDRAHNRRVTDTSWKPSKAQLAAAKTRTLRDVVARDLAILLCGINPGLYSAAVGHHFARPGNRFWPTLHGGGFTPRVLSPFEERELLALGYGITNVVDRATATADELKREELIAGGKKLVAKVKKYRPRVLAVVGLGAYRVAFDRPKAAVGPQEPQEDFVGETRLWVLPNPSGLNAHYQPKDLA